MCPIIPHPNDNVRRLLRIFGNRQGEPIALRDLLSKTDSPSTLSLQLRDRLTNMSHVFNIHVPSKEHWLLVEVLYYYFITKILEGEILNRPEVNLELLLLEDQLHRTLIVCCVEIVVYSYNPQRQFSTTLQWYNMHPYDFYRIIEMVVLYHQDALTRDIIKHLNVVEEQILESFAWEGDSPLWEVIRATGQPLPLCQDVDKPKMVVSSEVEENEKKSVMDIFTSPLGGKDFEETVITNSGDNTRSTSTSQEHDHNHHLLASTKLRKWASSLALFLRKFYKVASVRMLSLCKDFEMNDSDLLKVWSVFEHCIVEQTDLMKDRHLDDMIRCAIYMISRVTQASPYWKKSHCKSREYQNVFNERHNDKEVVRGDLILFYNTVYVKKMEKFFRKLTDTASQGSLLLSPMPESPTSQNMSPRQFTRQHHHIYIQPVDKNELQNIPGKKKGISYEFLKSPIRDSPSKDLVEINRVVNQAGSAKRAIFVTDDDNTFRKIPKITRKLANLIKDRQEQKKN